MKAQIDKLISKLKITVDTKTAFKAKIKALYELELLNYDISSLLLNEAINTRLIQLYLKLGYNRIERMDFNKHDIDILYNSKTPLTQIEFKLFYGYLVNNIEVGHYYPLKNIKNELQKLYDLIGIDKVAVATDIMRFYDVKLMKLPSLDGKFIENTQCFLIIGEFFKI